MRFKLRILLLLISLAAIWGAGRWWGRQEYRYGAANSAAIEKFAKELMNEVPAGEAKRSIDILDPRIPEVIRKMKPKCIHVAHDFLIIHPEGYFHTAYIIYREKPEISPANSDTHRITDTFWWHEGN